jgi:uncharacterized RDD family membrane protein YckC
MAHANAVPVSGSKLDNRRVLAAVIDLLIVGAGYALILAAAGELGDAGAGGALTAVGIGWALYYYFACESSDSGQTLGKRAMKIRVVSTNGAPADMRQIALRTVLRIIDGVFVYLVGLIVMLATRERRGRLGDLAGGTMIVSADKPAPVVDMSVPEAPAAVSRVPIAESGPAFAPVAEVEPEEPAEEEPSEDEPAEGPDVASPSLKELATDVTAVTEDPEREVEEEPEPEVEELPAAAEVVVEEEPVAEVEEEPAAEEEPGAEVEEEPVAEEEPTDEPEDEPVAEEPEDEPAEEMTVKSVETVSAIDLVMEGAAGEDDAEEDDAEKAVAAPQSKARQG